MWKRNFVLGVIFVIIFAIVSLLRAESQSSAPQSDTGYDLLLQCDQSEKPSQTSEMFCMGYVNAVLETMDTTSSIVLVSGTSPKPGIAEIDYHTAMAGTIAYCGPTSIQQGQAVLVVVKWLKEHPSDLHFSRNVLVFRAIRDSFPCNRQPRQAEKK